MAELKIEYLPVNKLKPYEKNARKHQEYDVGAIAASIKEFGFDDPIGVWGKDNVIVEGHGRLLAAKKLGIKTVPCIRLDHLNDEQRRAYALAHNKTAENSEWDFDILPEELESIVDIDMTQFGFEPDMEIPDELDDETEDSERIGVKITFDNYGEYEKYETELKTIAEKAGANLSVVKA